MLAPPSTRPPFPQGDLATFRRTVFPMIAVVTALQAHADSVEGTGLAAQQASPLVSSLTRTDLSDVKVGDGVINILCLCINAHRT